MPWLSKAQERWGNSPAGRRALGAKTVAEFNRKTKGKKLPTRVKKVKKNGKTQSHKRKRMSRKSKR